MRTVERMERAIAEAERRGLQIRFETLQGTTGGLCRVGQRRYVFVDLTATIADQLEQILSALRTLEYEPSAARDNRNSPAVAQPPSVRQPASSEAA